jgi:hypothetical protein
MIQYSIRGCPFPFQKHSEDYEAFLAVNVSSQVKNSDEWGQNTGNVTFSVVFVA